MGFDSAKSKDRKRRLKRQLILEIVVKGCREVGWKSAGDMRSREFFFIYSHDARRNSMYNGCLNKNKRFPLEMENQMKQKRRQELL